MPSDCVRQTSSKGASERVMDLQMNARRTEQTISCHRQTPLRDKQGRNFSFERSGGAPSSPLTFINSQYLSLGARLCYLTIVIAISYVRTVPKPKHLLRSTGTLCTGSFGCMCHNDTTMITCHVHMSQVAADRTNPKYL